MSNRVKAVVRVRPPFKTEVVVPGYTNVVRTISTNTAQKVIVAFQDHFREFDFDVVLGPEFKQDQVYQHVGAPLVDEVLKGYSSTLLAYGQTGTGKTYTLGILTAPRSEDQGIVTRALAHIFDYIESHPENEWAVAISCIQIYKEQIIDMLNPQHANMTLREDPQQGVFVEGLEALAVHSCDQALDVVNAALENRVMASTLMNATSSRSHTIIKIRLQQRITQGFEGAANQYRGLQFTKTVTGTLNLVDLAGSERIKKTNSSGERLEEAKSINVSLSTLGKVISALTTSGAKQAHIPFRDSKLTRLLQDSLGGNTNTTLIAAIGPSATHREETLSTLSFAMRCMKIKVAPVSDRVSVGESDYADWCLNLQHQIANLQQEFKEKEAMYIQKIKSLSEQSVGRDDTPRVHRSNSASSVQTSRASTPSASRPGAPDTWQPSHDFLFFHYQLLQEIAQTTVHLAQHTQATQPPSALLSRSLSSSDDEYGDADEMWALARERIEEKISDIHMGGTQADSTSKPFTDELTHPPLNDFDEERELIIYLIQLRSLINSNLDFALHWMDTRQGVVDALKRQLILQEVEALRKQREMEVWAEAMNQLIAENKQLRHALRSKKRDFRIAQENSKMLKLRLSEMNNSLSSQNKMAMVKVPFITGHDLVRLDKAIRTLQMRFLGRRKRRMANNVRRLHSHQRTAALSLEGAEGKRERRSGRERDEGEMERENGRGRGEGRREERGKRAENGDGANKWNGNGMDGANMTSDSTYDDVSINESSIASNDTTAEQNSEIVAKKRNRRSLMHKLGGLFSGDKAKNEGKSRSPQSSPDLEHRPGRSDSVGSDRSSSSIGSTGSSVLESSITAQLLQHRLKIKNSSTPATQESGAAPRQRSTSSERSRNAEALLRKAMREQNAPSPETPADPADRTRGERSAHHRERARAPSPAGDPSRTQERADQERTRPPSPANGSLRAQERSENSQARQQARNAADAEVLLRRMTAAHEHNEQVRRLAEQQNTKITKAPDDPPPKSTNPFSLSNFKRDGRTSPFLKTDASTSSVNTTIQRPPSPYLSSASSSSVDRYPLPSQPKLNLFSERPPPSYPPPSSYSQPSPPSLSSTSSSSFDRNPFPDRQSPPPPSAYSQPSPSPSPSSASPYPPYLSSTSSSSSLERYHVPRPQKPPIPAAFSYERQPPPPSQYHSSYVPRNEKSKSTPKRASPPSDSGSDDDFSQLDQFEKEMLN